jgi:hypothetical protein
VREADTVGASQPDLTRAPLAVADVEHEPMPVRGQFIEVVGSVAAAHWSRHTRATSRV